jgi:DNA-binding transcriptional MerR regulator
MRVSEIAARAGTTAGTIRFYEAEGVLPRAPRRDNRYRDYDERDLCRLRLVTALRGLGLALADAGRLAALCVDDRCGEMADDLAALVAERRTEVADAIVQLTHLDRELAGIQRSLATGARHELLCLGKETTT